MPESFFTLHLKVFSEGQKWPEKQKLTKQKETVNYSSPLQVVWVHTCFPGLDEIHPMHFSQVFIPRFRIHFISAQFFTQVSTFSALQLNGDNLEGGGIIIA